MLKTGTDWRGEASVNLCRSHRNLFKIPFSLSRSYAQISESHSQVNLSEKHSHKSLFFQMLPPTPRPTATGRETPPGTPTGEEPPPGASGLVQRRHSFSRHLLTHILISVSHDNVHGVFNFISILTSRSRWLTCGFRSIVRSFLFLPSSLLTQW